jgi:hypothetical protein
MKHTPPSRRARPTADVEQLTRLATCLSESSSRIEDAFWETRLASLINRLLTDGAEDTLIAALDPLYHTGSPVYDALADMIESCTETRYAGTPNELDALMIAVPILAWSRFPIPYGLIPPTHLEAIRTHLQAHVLAAETKLGLCNILYSPDQLPQTWSDTSRLTDKLTQAAFHDRDLKINPQHLVETLGFLSDSRYLLAAIAAPRGAPFFRWQEEDGDRATAFRQWVLQGGEALRPLLPACALQIQPVGAYHTTVRDVDRASRPWSLRSAVAFLQTVLNLEPANLHAVVAAFHDQELEEYRIGFTLHNSNDVIHGVIWPLVDSEDENSGLLAQIETILHEASVGRITLLDHRLPLEYCDDCGAPLYPNPEGDPVHAELPEEHAETAPRHLH